MELSQHRWSEAAGWTPDLSEVAHQEQDVAFLFGARSLLKDGKAVEGLRGRLPGASIIGCSTREAIR